MGVVETSAKKKRQKRNLQRALLLTLGVAGGLSLALIAPRALKLLKATGLDRKLKYRTLSALSRLKYKGEVEFVTEEGRTIVRLTPKGQETLELLTAQTQLALSKKKRWDRRYRLVMFDIVEKRKRVREALRRQMAEAGFLRIQDSAWVYPYDCEEYVALLKADLRVGREVLYAVIEEIDNDARIRRHFGLSLD